MMKVATVAAIACLAPAGLGFGPPALIESHQALVPLYAEQVAAIERFRPPALSAASVLVVEERSATTVYASGATTRRPMASLTKIMTALLAIERGRLEQTVKVNVDASQLVDSSVMGLRPGEEIALEDLLYGLLLPSGNDAALAIGEHIGGNVPRFVEMMNQRAVALGMADTRFANPHGLDAPDHYSTAADLLVLARQAMAHPVFARIVGTQERTVQGRLATYQLRNTNRLLGQYPGADGVKTGTTDAAGECLIVTAQRGEERLYGVVLDSPGRYTDTQVMLDYFYSGFSCRRLPPPSLSPFQMIAPGPAEEASPVADDPGAAPERYGGLYLSDAPWDCRPRWQARWLRGEAVVDGAATSGAQPFAGKAAFYLGDELLSEAQLERR